jgi:hypothetical protein
MVQDRQQQLLQGLPRQSAEVVQLEALGACSDRRFAVPLIDIDRRWAQEKKARFPST